jgi:hypothetical protein
MKKQNKKYRHLKDIPLDIRAEMALKEAVLMPLPNTKDGDTLFRYGAAAK